MHGNMYLDHALPMYLTSDLLLHIVMEGLEIIVIIYHVWLSVLSLSEMTGLTYFAALLDHLLYFAALLDLRLFWITYFAALLDHLLCGFIGSPSHVRHGMRIFIEN